MKVTYRKAIQMALREELLCNDDVYLIGEDIGAYGGCYGVTEGLLDEFGETRVMDTPISETAIVGSSIGAALFGKRPVAEIMFADFLPVVSDMLVNQANKYRYILGGDTHVPLVVRAPYGGGGRYSFNHSQSLESMFLNAPGLTVIMPSTPYDAKGLLKAAIRCNDPVLFLEQKYLYKTIEEEIPEKEYLVDIGKGIIRRVGRDVTIAATGWMVHKSMKAAQRLKEKGVDVEVIDPRTLKPLDEEFILRSVEKTGRLVIVHEACRFHGFGAEVAAMVSEKGFSSLKAPIQRVCAPDHIIPFAPVLEDAFYPDENDIIKAVNNIL